MAGAEWIRLCCGMAHDGPVCPDQMVMCCLCFDRFPLSGLHVIDPETGLREDVCIGCWEQEEREMREQGVEW